MKNCWSLRLSEVGFCLCLISSSGWAQFSEPDGPLMTRKVNSQYLFPIEPGKTAMLTGTMGELRNTHFHGGLDINTQTIGYPVRASNDGYIVRATASTSGYGNVLLIKHEDGNTTLYAHLNEFLGAVGIHVHEERYRRRQSEVDLTFAPNQFPVKRGDIIAFSGNTGSSGGPHLHFELRNSDNEALNPLTAGFSEVQDHLPPLVQKIALRTLTSSSRINDQFGRFEYYVVKKGTDYELPQPILTSGTIGLEVLAYDKQENSRFKFGINLIEVFVGDKRLFVQSIDKIKFSENRNILVLMDYRTLELKGQRYNKLYIDDGNRLPYYSGSISEKGIKINGELTPVEIKLTDYFGNASTIRMNLQASPGSKQALFMESVSKPLVAETFENILKISARTCAGGVDSTIAVYRKGERKNVSRDYYNNQSGVYLIDLKRITPDSITSCQYTWVSNWVDKIPSNTEYRYYGDQVEIEFPKEALYDTMMLRLRNDSIGGKEVIGIGSQVTPLNLPIKISYKPKSASYTPDRNAGIYRQEGNGYAYLGNNWKNGRFQFSTLSFGDFVILNDSLPPSIKPISLNGAVARLRIRDDLSGISYFEANIDGQWLLMNYDYKTGVLFSERQDKSKPLRGDFELKVVDNAGNESIFKQKIL
jgi:Peptidase family M23